jgi:hypothetical protein
VDLPNGAVRPNHGRVVANLCPIAMGSVNDD